MSIFHFAHSKKGGFLFLILLLCLSPFLFTSCAKKVGPKMIAASHGNYNEVVSCVQQKELLLNIVRRRYLEPVQFTSLGSISQSRSVTNSVGGSVALGGATTGGLNGNSSVADFPTYSLTPQSGPAATRALHSHIPLEVIPLLVSAGYPVDMVFGMLGQQIGPIRSVDIDAGGKLKGGSCNFKSVLFAMKHLEAKDKVSVANAVWEEKLFEHPFAPEVFSPQDVITIQNAQHRYKTTDDGQSFYVTSKTPQPVLWLSSDARSYGPGKELMSLLRLDSNYKKKGWALRSQEFFSETDLAGASKNSRNYLHVQTRSIMGVLNLLSHGVRIPPCQGMYACGSGPFCEAVKCGKAPDIPASFVVHWSDKCPEGAFVKVNHRCGWFYIDDADCCSKKYFNALFDLYNLAGPERIDSGSSSSRINSPVLTLR